MRKRHVYAFLFALSPLFSTIKAQSLLTINSGTDLYVAPATAFTVKDVTLTPSAGFLLNGNSLHKNAVAVNPTFNTNYVRNVYTFSANTLPFSGTIRFRYDAAELNGMAEGNLEVNIYRGDRWVDITSATNDVLQHYVLSMPIGAEPLSEIALADAAIPLPLTWGAVSATREDRVTIIRWNTLAESNVRYFDVERSTDGLKWSKVITSIPAQNTSQGHHYQAVDQQYITTGLLYRIRQTDSDGRFTYSKVVAVAPLDAASTVSIFPNPVVDHFQIIHPAPLAIRQVKLYNNAGTEVRSWTTQTQPYAVGDLPKGVYHLILILKDGKRKQFKLIKL